MKKYLALSIIMLTLCSFTMHKYYISLTQIEHSTKHQSLQIQMRVFMDDIELAIKNNDQIDLKLTSKNEVKESDSLLFKYIDNNFNVYVNNQERAINYIGKEFDGDAINFYLEIENVETLNLLKITNSILFDTYTTQENVIKIKVNDIHKTFILTTKNDKGLLKF